jgi:hypothetical protein
MCHGEDRIPYMQREDHLTFRRGNTKIIVMENYEALGRYTAATEQARVYRNEYHTSLIELWKRLERAASRDSSSDSFPRTGFDVQEGRELLNRIDEAQQNMTVAINEANLYADDCKKPKLQTFEK